MNQRYLALKLAGALAGYAIGAAIWLALTLASGSLERQHLLAWSEVPAGTRTIAFALAGPLGALAAVAIVNRGLEATRNGDGEER